MSMAVQIRGRVGVCLRVSERPVLERLRLGPGEDSAVALGGRVENGRASWNSLGPKFGIRDENWALILLSCGKGVEWRLISFHATQIFIRDVCPIQYTDHAALAAIQ